MATKKTSSSESKESATQNPLSRFIAYAEDSRAELRKVSWPTLKETRGATLVVLGFVTVMSILLGLVDLGLSSIIQLILAR